MWNIKPERWPAGAPQRLKPGADNELLPMHGIDGQGTHRSDWAYTDIDESPTKSYIIENREQEEVRSYFHMAHDKRPEYELFDVRNDPENLNNLAGDSRFETVENEMKEILMEELEKSGDPRVTGPDKEIFDSYPRYSPMREFPKPDGSE